MSQNELKVTILGCGNSVGVPNIGRFWGECDPNEPKNKRLRSSILVEKGNTKIIVDTGPDFRTQINNLKHDIRHIDAVLYTHEHPDHTQGIFDLRPFHVYTKKPVDIYGRGAVLQELENNFSYLFKDSKDGLYKKCLEPHEILTDKLTLGTDAISIEILQMDHGNCTTLGFIFDRKIAYTTDVIHIPEHEMKKIYDIPVWIVECSYMEGEIFVHSNWTRTKDWIAEVKPKHAYLTDMSCYMDYHTVNAATPDNVAPAYDGLEIVI